MRRECPDIEVPHAYAGSVAAARASRETVLWRLVAGGCEQVGCCAARHHVGRTGRSRRTQGLEVRALPAGGFVDPPAWTVEHGNAYPTGKVGSVLIAPPAGNYYGAFETSGWTEAQVVALPQTVETPCRPLPR
jgi:hypothetical protein